MATLKLEDINKAAVERERIVTERRRKEAEAVARILYKKFGTTDLDELRVMITNRKVKLVYSQDHLLIGVSIYNRWLYTIDGQVIGKEGNRWMIEKIIWH